jgi:hypothetical protein
MSEFRNKEYIESMSLIKLSDDKKEKMISDLTKISPIRKEGMMKKRLGVKKTAILVAACIMVFGVTATATGIATGVVSHNKPDTRTGNFGDLEKLEQQAGLHITAVESFSNGYEFDHMEVGESTTQDDSFNDIQSYMGISMQYIKENEPYVAIYMDPIDMVSGDASEDAMASRKVGDVDVYYSCDEYLFVPVSEADVLTDEEKNRDANDPHFFISVGSDERETRMSSAVSFVMGDVYYCMLSFDTNMNADEMMDMAEEIINAR